MEVVLASGRLAQFAPKAPAVLVHNHRCPARAATGNASSDSAAGGGKSAAGPPGLHLADPSAGSGRQDDGSGQARIAEHGFAHPWMLGSHTAKTLGVGTTSFDCRPDGRGCLPALRTPKACKRQARASNKSSCRVGAADALHHEKHPSPPRGHQQAAKACRDRPGNLSGKTIEDRQQAAEGQRDHCRTIHVGPWAGCPTLVAPRSTGDVRPAADIRAGKGTALPARRSLPRHHSPSRPRQP